MTIAVRMIGITKRFPGVVANDNVDFELNVGEIHTLLGENGAGKTTLMNILCGFYSPDFGEIYVWGKRVDISSPRDAMKLGIFMIPQTPKLVLSMSVLENVIIGLKSVGIIFSKKKVEEKILDIAKKFNININPRAKIYSLSASERKRVEIIKALMRNAKVLVFDEPTATLSPVETKKLFDFMRRFKENNGSVIFITHKLHEALEISDRITVMRKGRVVGTIDKAHASEELLTKWMFGESIKKTTYHRKTREDKMTILKVEDLYVKNDAGEQVVNGVSFEIRMGEIFGIAGVAGNGQKELVEAIMGLRKIKKGKILLRRNGREIDVTKFGLRLTRDFIGFIPEDRITHGIAPSMSVAENLVLKDYKLPIFSGIIMLKMDKILEWARSIVKNYRIKTPNINTPVKYLSGGNIQKLIVARELSRDPQLIIAMYPTLGLDVKTTRIVRQKLVEARNRGAAIILISEDLDEILELSDRIAVIYRGSIIKIFEGNDINKQEIGRLMIGGR